MKQLKYFFYIVTFFITAILVRNTTYAYEFPIQELGTCPDQASCRQYCETPQHKAACWSYHVYKSSDGVLAAEDITPEQKVATLGITFPIVELGNCPSIGACRQYCTVTQNQTACQTFAKKSGLTNQQKILEKATTELGCSTTAQCNAFCQQVTNQTACQDFAKKYNLKGALLDKLTSLAQQELGCKNREECKAKCQLPQNKDICQQITQRLQLGQGKREELVSQAKTILGCDSFESCRTFCQNPANHDKCRNFGQAVSGHLNTIPGNCRTTEECRKACEQNPATCPGFPKTGSGSGELKRPFASLPPKQPGTASNAANRNGFPLRPTGTNNLATPKASSVTSTSVTQ